MGFFDVFMKFFPEVKGPTEKRLSFKIKLKWTLIILVAFFVLSVIPLYGLGANELAQFESLSIILGASFGSLMSLGIGPIVTASIVLQLLTGSGLLKIKTDTPEGKTFFQGLQKVLALFFIIFEALIYVFMGGLAPPEQFVGTSTFFGLQLLLVFQLFLGGLMVLFMDEVINKWGFGSGISLFIAAGVSSSIFVRAFSPLTSAGTFALGSGQAPIGQVWVFFVSLMGGNPQGALLALAAIVATILVFVIAVYAQAMKVEIPLSFGRVRGHGMRWPLQFIYTSNIPVILIAALLANVQLMARLLQNWGHPLLGTFIGNTPASGFVLWIFPPNLLNGVITGGLRFMDLLYATSYALFMIGGAILFSVFWVQTAGMDAKSQAKKILSSGMQIPGFRRDPRVLEQILNRYIPALTVLGGIAVGILAASADLLGALSNGTGILLTVMIIYKLYEEVAQQHMMDMHPALRKMME
jgi:preprotein translocase subunit SecY|tara:strand:+ start:36871 stop:38274 length:1404 start_codon:yes stop_codon:yes gene_type:complete